MRKETRSRVAAFQFGWNPTRIEPVTEQYLQAEELTQDTVLHEVVGTSTLVQRQH